MNILTCTDLLALLTEGLFILGGLTYIIGLIILISRTMGKDIRTLTNQTTRLAQKGITDDIAGLIGNASALLSATSELIRTTAGIGVFLTVLGLILMGVAIGLLYFAV